MIASSLGMIDVIWNVTTLQFGPIGATFWPVPSGWPLGEAIRIPTSRASAARSATLTW